MFFSFDDLATDCYDQTVILSDYERKDSPFVWIQFGENYADRQYLKTSIRKNDPQRKRKVALELHRIEAQLLPIVEANPTTRGGTGAGWRWVTAYLETRYSN